MTYRTFILAIVGLVFFSTISTAEDRYTPINTALMNEVFLPNFKGLADAADEQHHAWEQTCAAPALDGEKVLRKAFHKTMDAWALVFHWNIGPITQHLRRDSLYHWPERRNSIGKSLANLLANEQPEKLSTKRFSKASVAVQGLPALERLLFEDIDVTKNAWACKVGMTIALNVQMITKVVERELREEIEPLLNKGTPHPDFFDQPSDFINRVFNELVTGYRIIKDQKILMISGVGGKSSKPNRIENRRSKRFEKNLKLNLHGLLLAQKVIARFLTDAHQNKLSKGFEDVHLALKELGHFETGIKNKTIQPQIKVFLATLDAVRNAMAKEYVDQLDLIVGFNSLDGD